MCCGPCDVAPIERFSAYPPLSSNCVQSDGSPMTGQDAGADAGVDGDKKATSPTSSWRTRKLLGETPDRGIEQQAAKLVAKTGAADDRFGAVSINDDGDTLVVGAYGADSKVGRCRFKRVHNHVESAWFQRLRLRYDQLPSLLSILTCAATTRERHMSFSVMSK